MTFKEALPSVVKSVRLSGKGKILGVKVRARESVPAIGQSEVCPVIPASRACLTHITASSWLIYRYAPAHPNVPRPRDQNVLGQSSSTVQADDAVLS